MLEVNNQYCKQINEIPNFDIFIKTIKDSIQNIICKNNSEINKEIINNYLDLFDLKNDLQIKIIKNNNKSFYNFQLNKSWIKKIELIYKILCLQKYLKISINQEFDYRITKNSIWRYNNKQDNEDYILDINDISNLEKNIEKIEQFIDSNKFEEIKIHLKNDKQKYIKYIKKIEIYKNILKQLKQINNIDLIYLDQVIFDLWLNKQINTKYIKNNFENNVENNVEIKKEEKNIF